jgi:hypothetical protein
MSLWITPAALRAGVPRAQRPGPALVLAHGEEGQAPKQVVGSADAPVEGGLGDPQVGHEGRGVGGVELGDLRLDAGGQRHHLGVRARRHLLQAEGGRPLLEPGGVGLVRIDDQEQRLQGQEGVAAQALLVLLGQLQVPQG